MLYQPWVFSRISPFTKAVLTGSTASSSSSLRPNVTPQAAILATKGSKKGRRYKMIQGLDMMKIGDIWNNHLWYEWVYNCIYIYWHIMWSISKIESPRYQRYPKITKGFGNLWGIIFWPIPKWILRLLSAEDFACCYQFRDHIHDGREIWKTLLICLHKAGGALTRSTQSRRPRASKKRDSHWNHQEKRKTEWSADWSKKQLPVRQDI